MAKSHQILPELLRLPAAQRARLAAELVRSLDESEDGEAAGAWISELDRRARAVIEGSAKLESWDRVRRRIEARLRSRQT